MMRTRRELGGDDARPCLIDDLSDCRTPSDRKASARAARAAQARHASGRRRLVDPTTCERDYSAAEWEFLRAIEEYKRCSGRQFPSWSEVLRVVHDLGYAKAGVEVAR